jgi:hypothetical protein
VATRHVLTPHDDQPRGAKTAQKEPAMNLSSGRTKRRGLGKDFALHVIMRSDRLAIRQQEHRSHVCRGNGELSGMQETASGQDFWWFGTADPSSGQQGIPSGMDMDCISSIVPMEMRTIAAAPYDAATGAIKRPTTARIENRRWNRIKHFTTPSSHMLRRKKRGIALTFPPAKS